MTPADGIGAALGSAEIRVQGQEIDVLLANQLLELRLETHLLLPDTVSMSFADPQFEYIDSAPFEIGADLEVLLAAPEATTLTSSFAGQITTFEPEFTERHVLLSVRGYDRSYLMNRERRVETYQEMSYGDIARKVAARNGLAAGEIDSAGESLKFVQQSAETDWSFLWRLARPVGYEVTVEGTKLNFRPAKSSDTGPVSLAWGKELLSFRPRVSGVGQVSSVVVRGWDPTAAQAIVGEERSPQLTSSIGLERSELISSLGDATVTVSDHPVSTQVQADAVATGVAERLANAYLEAEGTAIGDPQLRAGVGIRVDGIGTRFGGTYALTEAIHVIHARLGYRTHVRVSGRAIRGLDPPLPAAATPWHNSVVVGVVTNNSDPEGLGRVRVKCPTLADDHEGWWARIAAPGAGANRGLLMLPVAGDEVLLAFEHAADEHPYIIGSLWNGQAQPQTLVHADGSFALRSDHQLSMQAAEQIEVKGDQAITLQAGSDLTAKATGKLDLEAQSEGTLQANTSLTVKGVESVTVQGTQATLKGDGTTTVSAGGQMSLQSDGQLVVRGTEIQIQASALLQISAPQIMLG